MIIFRPDEAFEPLSLMPDNERPAWRSRRAFLRVILDRAASRRDEGGILASSSGKFAFGRARTWFGDGAGQTFHDGFGCAKLLQLAPDARADIAGLVLVLAAMAGPEHYVKRWRTVLHITLPAVIVAVLGLAITPAAHAAAAAATLSVEHTWQTGFIARFTITNASMAPVSDWKLEFDMPPGQSVLHAWNSTVTQSGTHYVVAPANWNRVIAPGGSATGGFRGALSGSYSPPANCVLNGQYPCT